MSYASKSVASVGALVVMAIVFSRQMFLFMAFRNPEGLLDSQGGRHHLWLSLFAAGIACIAGALMFYFFARVDRDELSQPHHALPEPANTVPTETRTVSSPAARPFDKAAWARLNPWLSEGGSDDRRPVDGSVADSRGTPSDQRTLARESHQLKFKQWSQARSD